MTTELIKQSPMDYLISRDILVSPEIYEKISKLSIEQVNFILLKIHDDKDFFMLEDENLTEYLKLFNNLNTTQLEKLDSDVEILYSYDEKPIKREILHFVEHFRNRFKTFEKMIAPRAELVGRISISRALQKKEKDTISVIGMILDISLTKNNNLMIKLEDMSGIINVLINQNNKENFFMGKNLVFDEVIGINGVANNGIIFANRIILPDIPLTKELKKSPLEDYAAFIGDPHFGSKEFLKKEFIRLIKWFNGQVGNASQKEIAKKTKYLFIVGDLVDGVGIYPGQEDDLDIPDIYEQYNEFVRYLKKIPSRIKIIICPGNHDAMRVAEPQPPLYKDYAKELYEMENVSVISNPSMINIGKTKGFEGFDVLLYHGYSLIYYADTLEYVRSKGGIKRADLVMEQLLRKRHLAPSHKSNLYVPDRKNDPLIISKIPDFFVTGHIHRTTAKMFNNISLLNCSCWLGQTEFQEKVGLKPQPARLILSNLATREIKVMKFGKDEYTLDDNK